MAKKQAANGKTERKPRTAKPKDHPLPGMEDARIQALEQVATDYADIRDQRMELNADEAKLKTKAMRLMLQHGKTVYKRNGIEIRIVAGEDDLKVRVKPVEEKTDVSISGGA